ncbi:MAG: ABC transporter transmembrane domain-containing protein, partial [Actinomycetota bacterium]|nr:ABC transporter transmembrane domain-containing protein [Actinomycetota bacterium]
MTDQPSTGRPLALIRTLVSQSPKAYAYVALAAALATVPSVLVPLLERAFVDQYLVAGNRQWSTPVVIGMVAAALLIAAALLKEYRTLARLSVRIGATASTRLTWQILRLPVPTIERWGTGDLTARVGALQYYSLLSGLFVPMALASVVTIAVYTIVVVTLNWVLALVGLATVACSVLVSSVLLRRILQSRADATLIALTAGTTDTVASIETIKAAGWEPWVFDRWSQRRSEAMDAWSDLAMDGQRVGLVPTLTYTFGLGLSLAVGSLLVFAGDLSLGTLAAAQTLLLAIFVLTRQLVTIGTLVEWVGSIQHQADAVALLDLDPEATSTGAGHVRPDGPVELELRGVTFGYEADEPPLLSELALHVPAGSWLAVVGASGSGKSTLARLAIGELQPWRGSVRLDGRPRLD